MKFLIILTKIDVFEEEPLKKLAKSGNLYFSSHMKDIFSLWTHIGKISLNNIWDKGLAPWKIWK